MTNGTLSLMGNLATKSPVPNLMPEVQFLPYPYSYRCPFGLKGNASVDANLHYIENLLSDSESGVSLPAGIILEAVQGEGGVIPAPIRWLQGLRDITLRYDIPLIMDEVQSGIGRTGSMFAFEHANIIPDIVVMSKAIGGGLPMSVIVYNKSLDTWEPGAHAGTFRGNQMGMVAGSATLDTIHSEGLCTNAKVMGQRLTQHLISIKKDYSYIGDVRGKGLMLGVEIIKPETKTARKQAAPNGNLATSIQKHCIKRGLILELGGRDGSTVRFLPPLIIQKEEIDRVAEIFSLAVNCAIKEYNSDIN